jgi:hypothetical protein
MNNHLKISFLLLAAILLMASACSSAKPAPASMAGFWMDNDNNATTIQEKDGAFVAVTVYDLEQSHSQNSLVSSSWENSALTWKFCPPAKSCITMQTTAFHGDTLDVTWKNDDGGSGSMTLKRVEKGTN